MKLVLKIMLYVVAFSIGSYTSATQKEALSELQYALQTGKWTLLNGMADRYLDMGGDPNIRVAMPRNIVTPIENPELLPLINVVFDSMREDNVDYSVPLAKMLIENQQTNLTPVLLFYAMAKNQPELFVLLLKRGVSPDKETIAYVKERAQESAQWKYVADNLRIMLLEQEVRKVTEELEQNANKARNSGSNVSSQKK